MYKLFSRVEGGLPCIVKCMSAHLRDAGRNIVTEEPGADAPGRNATSYIHNLLELHDQYAMFLDKSFGSDKLFKNAIQSVSPLWEGEWGSEIFYQTLCTCMYDLSREFFSFPGVIVSRLPDIA